MGENGSTQQDPVNAARPVQLTERAVRQLIQVMREDGAVGFGLRVGVIGGGSTGLQYLLDFVRRWTDEDSVYDQGGVTMVVDPYSAAYLQGTEIDWIDDERGRGFLFKNPIVRELGPDAIARE